VAWQAITSKTILGLLIIILKISGAVIKNISFLSLLMYATTTQMYNWHRHIQHLTFMILLSVSSSDAVCATRNDPRNFPFCFRIFSHWPSQPHILRLGQPNKQCNSNSFNYRNYKQVYSERSHHVGFVRSEAITFTILHWTSTNNKQHLSW